MHQPTGDFRKADNKLATRRDAMTSRRDGMKSRRDGMPSRRGVSSFMPLSDIATFAQRVSRLDLNQEKQYANQRDGVKSLIMKIIL